MWWSDPAKEVLNIVRPELNLLVAHRCLHVLQVFNRVLAPYVENLDMGQVNYGIGQGADTRIILNCMPHNDRLPQVVLLSATFA